jgi:hypothetical protein
VVGATLDTGGNYVLSDTPSAYPVAIIYTVQQLLKDYDSTSSEIIGSVGVQPTISQPLNQIAYGTGSGLTSSPNFTTDGSDFTYSGITAKFTASAGFNFSGNFFDPVSTQPFLSPQNRTLNNSTGATVLDFSGTHPTAVTPTAGDNTAKIATTAFVTSAVGSYVPATRTISTTAPLAGGGALSSNLTLSIPAATSSINGYLLSTDWSTFNGKENALTFSTGLSRSGNTITDKLASGVGDSTQGWTTGLGAITHLLGPTDQPFLIKSAVGTSPAQGQDLNFTAANGVGNLDATVRGGDINLTAGNSAGTTSSPRGGNVNIIAGNANNTGGSNLGGIITIQGGAPTLNGGGVIIKTVTGSSNTPTASIQLITGTSGGPASTGGQIFSVGSVGSVGGNSGGQAAGNFVFNAGIGATSGTAANFTGGQASDFIFTGAAGGATAAVSGTTVAGRASNFTFTGATGGASTATGTLNTGGAGSSISFTAGNGGASTGVGTTNTAGAAGAITFTTGAGAVASGASSNNSTNGGAFTVTTGAAGASNAISGAVSITSGSAGAATSGNVTFASGDVTTGLSGNVVIKSGSPVGGNGNAGSVAISTGNNAGGGGSPTLSITSGNATTTAAQVNGSALNLTSGNGSSNASASGTSGNAGTIKLQTGNGGNSVGATSTGGNGGTLSVVLGNAGTGTTTGGTAGQISITQTLSGSDATPAILLSPTWNTTGTPTAFKINVTDTASNTNSLLQDLQVASASVFKVGKNGAITTAITTETVVSASNGTNSLKIGIGNGGAAAAGTNYIQNGVNTVLSFSNAQVNVPVGNLSMSAAAGSNTIYGNVNVLVASNSLKIGPNTTSGGQMTMTAGNQVDVLIGGMSNYTFAPTSGTATYTQFKLTPTINQTAGVATGITRSVFVQPTLTSAADYRAIEASAGKIALPVTVSSTATLTLGNGRTFVNTNAAATWTLPAVTGTTQIEYIIKNRGAGPLTLSTTAALNEIYDLTGLATNSLIIAAGAAVILISDGTYWDQIK